MPRIPIETPLQYLARRVFPDYRLLTAEDRSILGSLAPTQARSEEFEAWWNKHAALPGAELSALVAAEREREAQERAQKAALKEKARYFHQPDAAADFTFWSKTAHWTLDEAIALSLGKSPAVVKMDRVKTYAMLDIDGWPPSPFAVEYMQRWELSRRALTWKQLYDPVLPALFLAWARRLDLPVPSELTAAVESRGLVIADWQGLHDKQKEMAESWKKAYGVLKQEADLVAGQLEEARVQLTRVHEELDELKSRPAPDVGKDLATRERDTLLKLVIGMAIEGYRYDPNASRSETAAEIAGDLAKQGISITDDTVRKWLKEAASLALGGKKAR